MSHRNFNSILSSVSEKEFEFQWEVNHGPEWNVESSFLCKSFWYLLVSGPTR